MPENPDPSKPTLSQLESSRPDPSHPGSSPEEPVCKTWARLVEIVLGLFLVVGTGFMAHYYAPPPPLSLPLPSNPATEAERRGRDQLVERQREALQQSELQQNELRQLTRDVDELKQEQAMPALVLNRYRNSICYI